MTRCHWRGLRTLKEFMSNLTSHKSLNFSTKFLFVLKVSEPFCNQLGGCSRLGEGGLQPIVVFTRYFARLTVH